VYLHFEIDALWDEHQHKNSSSGVCVCVLGVFAPLLAFLLRLYVQE